MNTKGRGVAVNDDALIHAAKYRANTENRRPPVGADFSGLNEAGILRPLPASAQRDHDGAVGVCDRAITVTGCQIAPGAPCPDPDHPAHVEWALFYLYALNLRENPHKTPKFTDEWGRRISPGKHRGKRTST